jgi:hypothetical protein
MVTMIIPKLVVRQQITYHSNLLEAAAESATTPEEALAVRTALT